MNNREIKFRAWSKELQMMFAQTDINCNGKCSFAWNCNDKGKLHNYAGTEYEKDCVLMQYTGLKDNNGVEIYEGDIIIYWNDRPCPVIYERGQFTFQYEADTPTNSRMGLGYYDSRKMEVIGNIYENPELFDS